MWTYRVRGLVIVESHGIGLGPLELWASAFDDHFVDLLDSDSSFLGNLCQHQVELLKRELTFALGLEFGQPDVQILNTEREHKVHPIQSQLQLLNVREEKQNKCECTDWDLKHTVVVTLELINLHCFASLERALPSNPAFLPLHLLNTSFSADGAAISQMKLVLMLFS